MGIFMNENPEHFESHTTCGRLHPVTFETSKIPLFPPPCLTFYATQLCDIEAVYRPCYQCETLTLYVTPNLKNNQKRGLVIDVLTKWIKSKTVL